MPEDLIFHLLVLFVLFVLSAFFSGSETALMAIDRLRLKHLVEKERPGALRLDELLEKPDRLLSTILVGNNLVNIAASVFATAMFIRYYGDRGELLTILVLTPLLLIFAEVCPKTYAAQYPEKISFLVLRPILLVMWVLTPVTWMVSGFVRLMTMLLHGDEERPLISEDEIRTIISVGEQSGVVDAKQRRMLHGVFELSQTRVRDVMVPRTEVVGIDVEAPFADILTQVQRARHSRFPVFEENIDNIVGIVHSKDILNYVHRPNEFNLREVSRKPYFVPESKLVETLLQSFREMRVHLAIVVDEYGGVEGIVTLEDILEEVVGEIVDEYDLEEALIRKTGENRYLIDGSTSLKAINSRFDLSFSEEHANTLAGFVLQQLGKIPEQGDVCREEHVELRVSRMDDRRIDLVEMNIDSAQAESS